MSIAQARAMRLVSHGPDGPKPGWDQMSRWNASGRVAGLIDAGLFTGSARAEVAQAAISASAAITTGRSSGVADTPIAVCACAELAAFGYPGPAGEPDRYAATILQFLDRITT